MRIKGHFASDFFFLKKLAQKKCQNFWDLCVVFFFFSGVWVLFLIFF